MVLRHSSYPLVLFVTLILAGCANNAAPLPTVASIAQLPTTSAASATTPPSVISATPGPTITRTPLPSLTPSIAPNRNVTQTTLQPIAATKTIAPVQGEATLAPAKPIPPTSTSALAAATVQTSTPQLPTKAALLPGSKPPLTINLPQGWQFAYQTIPVRSPLAEASMNL